MIKLNPYNYLVLANAIKNGASFKLVTPDDEVITTSDMKDGEISFVHTNGVTHCLDSKKCGEVVVSIDDESFHLMAKRYDQDSVKTLTDLFSAFSQPTGHLAAGDIVQWKVGLKDRTTPEYGQLVIVTEILEKPVLAATNEELDSAYYCPKYDIKIGLKLNDKFCEFVMDSRRFERVNIA